jgi:hypothetical protein
MTDVTQLLSALDQGDPHAASRLLPPVHGERRQLVDFCFARDSYRSGPGG